MPKSHGNLSKIIIWLALVAAVGLFGFLTVWEMPAPSTRVEKVIDDAQFR